MQNYFTQPKKKSQWNKEHPQLCGWQMLIKLYLHIYNLKIGNPNIQFKR